MYPFEVIKKYQRGSEKIAKFNKQNEATDYIRMALTRDKPLNQQESYLLYDSGELMEEFNVRNMSVTETEQGQGSQQASKQAFRPSPLQTAPRPPGMPPSSFKDEDEAKKK